eukprot:367942_1
MADPKEIYNLIKEIGSGSFGAVYKAQNKKTKKIVAIKKVPHHNYKAINREINALTKCNSNFIVKYFCHHSDADFQWIVSEYCAGGSIEVNAGKYNEAEIKHIASCVLQGLKYLHDANIIHRDVKPETILFHPQENTYKLTGLDQSEQVDQSGMNKAREDAGTIRYMAPELMAQENMKIYNNKIDIWSFGITLYYLATNRFPYKSDGMMV